MVDDIVRNSSRRTAVIVFILVVFGASAAEIVREFMGGQTLLTMWDDMAWFAVSAILLAIFFYERQTQQRELGELRGQLDSARGKLAELDAGSPELASQYRAVMQKQFDAWHLSASEQDVVIGMLKGLSLREIAELRDTREKTVRQQASSVYRKAGVGSRHELAAWFFEDMLEPRPTEG